MVSAQPGGEPRIPNQVLCSVHHTVLTPAQEVASLLQERMPAGQADLLSDLLITGTEYRPGQ